MSKFSEIFDNFFIFLVGLIFVIVLCINATVAFLLVNFVFNIRQNEVSQTAVINNQGEAIKALQKKVGLTPPDY